MFWILILVQLGLHVVLESTRSDHKLWSYDHNSCHKDRDVFVTNNVVTGSMQRSWFPKPCAWCDAELELCSRGRCRNCGGTP
jgi:hypothetical protein